MTNIQFLLINLVSNQLKIYSMFKSNCQYVFIYKHVLHGCLIQECMYPFHLFFITMHGRKRHVLVRVETNMSGYQSFHKGV